MIRNTRQESNRISPCTVLAFLEDQVCLVSA